MRRMLPSFLVAVLVTCCPLTAQRKDKPKTALPPGGFVKRPAVFDVTTDVVNPSLEAFTVTAGGFGNSMIRGRAGGFEPVNYRTRLWASKDSPDRVYARNLSYYDTWRSGYLDGASVRIYRVINGKMRLVREDRVPPGGTVIADWNVSESKLIKPDRAEYSFRWAPWSRPGSTRWFTVFAVDKWGNRSGPATPVKVKRPDAGGKGAVKNETIGFRKPRNPRDSDPPPAPADLQAAVQPDGTIRFRWKAVQANDLAGYTFGRTDVDPAQHKGQYLQLAETATDPGKHVKTGDMVIVAKVFREFDRGLCSHRLGNLPRVHREYFPAMIPEGFYPDDSPARKWRLADHSADTPVADPGRTYLEITLPANDETAIKKYSVAGTKGNWYRVFDNRQHTAEVWLKADRDDASPVTFRADGNADIVEFVGTGSFRPTTKWRKFTHTFTGRVVESSRATQLCLEFRGPATYGVDNFRVYRSDTPYLDYTPEEYRRLKESGMAAFRTHGPIKTGTSTYSMEQFTNAAGSLEGIFAGNTLPQMLRMMEKAGVHPWLQIEFHMSPKEWLGFVEYMAAPYDPAKDKPADKPWAYKRYRQGRKAPWTEAFDRIYFEIANETWNWLFNPWVFESMTDAATGEKYNRGRVYGMMHDHVARILRSSPYWNDELEKKFIHALGGWSGSNYGREAVAGSDAGQFMLIAAYNGGWDEGEGPPRVNPASFFNVLNQTNQTAIPRARKHLQEAIDWRKAGKKARLGTYEAGPGYALNGLNNARVTKEQAREQELVMKSKVAGTATLDSFLARAYHDFDLQNFFTFGEGTHWKSHAKWYRGGRAYPCFLSLALFNREGTGDMLSTRTLSVATVNTAKFRRREAVSGAPLAAVYATRNGRRVNVFCISRRFPGYPQKDDDGFTPFTVQLPFTGAEKITLHRMSGAPTDHNIDGERVKLETTVIPPDAVRKGKLVINEKTGGDGRGLPPAETFLYVFENTDIGPPGRRLTPVQVLAQPVTFTGK